MGIRCRNFDNDGEPIKGGCRRGTECTFIHPGDPGWAYAVRPKGFDANSNRSSGSSHSHSRGNSGRDFWSAPTPSKKSDDGSTERSRGSAVESSATKDATAVSPVSNNWNGSSDNGETSKTGTEGNTSGGWSWTDTRGGWGVDKSVGWGGSVGEGWGGANADDNTINDQKGKRKETQMEDVVMGDSSPPRTGGSFKPIPPGHQKSKSAASWDEDTNVGWGTSGGRGAGWGNSGANASSGSVDDGRGGRKAGDDTSTAPNDQKGKSKDTQKEDVDMRDSSPPRTAKTIPLNNNKQESATQHSPSPSNVTFKPRPLLPSRQKKSQPFEEGILTKLAVQLAKRSDKESEQVLGNSSEAQTQTNPALLSSKTVHGPKDRADLFSQVIKHTSTVVLHQVELQRAQRDHARWKRTQESNQYERASHATRLILDGHRAELNQRVQEARSRLARALTALVELPDFASRNRKTPGPILTKTTIAAYTQELRDWFSDLELHKRLLMDQAAATQTDLPPAPVHGDSVTPVEPHLTARQLSERGNWTWDDLKNATKELDARVLAVAEHFYSDAYTTIDDLKDQVANLQDPGQKIKPPAKRRNRFDALSATANRVGDNLSAQAIRTVELMSRIHELEKERERVDSETRAMNKLCAEAEVLFAQFEQWQRDDEAKIQELAEQLRTLHLRRKAPREPTAYTSLQPAQLAGILTQMRPIIIQHMHQEVQPIVDALRTRCLENHAGVKSLIEELVKPVLVMTDDICHRASVMSLTSNSK